MTNNLEIIFVDGSPRQVFRYRFGFCGPSLDGSRKRIRFIRLDMRSTLMRLIDGYKESEDCSRSVDKDCSSTTILTTLFTWRMPLPSASRMEFSIGSSGTTFETCSRPTS